MSSFLVSTTKDSAIVHGARNARDAMILFWVNERAGAADAGPEEATITELGAEELRSYQARHVREIWPSEANRP